MSSTPESFEAWFVAHARRLVATLTAATSDDGLAQDAVGEAAARALVRWRLVGSMPDPTAWVYRVALNEVRRRKRRQQREQEHYSAPFDPAVCDPEPDVDLWRIVACLPDRMRLAVTLRYVGDLQENQIADVMGISRGGVSSLLAKANARLRAQPYINSRCEEEHGRT
jgi:RNA polymerase sigma-70 factor (ECF subfamily)